MFKFDLQLFAHKKGVSSTRNGRDSEAKRLGVKEQAGTVVTAGSIIVRQRGTHFHPGNGVGIGKDDTIYAKIAGRVAFERKGRSSQDGEGESYTLTDLDGVNRIDCKSGFGFYAEPRAESQWAAAKRGPGPSPTFRCASSLKHRLRRETR